MNDTKGNLQPDHLTLQQVAIIIAIIIAAIMTGLYTRFLQTSLADLRGIWGLSVDEGTWVYTFAVAPQMLVAPVIPWLIIAFGVRKIMLPAALTFITATLITPFVSGFIPLIVIHFIIGAMLGCFITATILIITHYIPPKWWLIPFGLFAFRLGFAMNASVSIGALYVENDCWQWIYWQSAALMMIYIVIVYFCIPVSPQNKEMLKNIDVSGMVLFCVATTLLYIIADQGEHLGWFDSSMITVLSLAVVALLVGFIINEMIVPNPWIPYSRLKNRNIIIAILLICCFVFVFMGNIMLITQFLGIMHALKAFQSGQALLVVALLQLVLIPISIWVVKRTDSRLVYAFGITMMGLACYQGTFVTSDWVALDFVPMGLMFAIGNTFVFMAIMALCIGNFNPQYIASILAVVQIGRVLGPTMAGSALGVFIRSQKDFYSIFLKERLTLNNPIVANYLGTTGSTSSLNSLVNKEAYVLTFQDTFGLCFWISVIALILVMFMRPTPPSPLCPLNIEKK